MTGPRQMRLDPKPRVGAAEVVGDASHAVHLAPNGQRLAVVRDGLMTLNDIHENRVVASQLPARRVTGFQSVSWSASSEWLAHIDSHGIPQLLQWSTGESVHLASNSAMAIAVDADGSQAATLDLDKHDVVTVFRHGIPSAVRLPRDALSRTNYAPRLAFSPDRRRLAIASATSTIVVLNLTQWEVQAELRAHQCKSLMDLTWIDDNLIIGCGADGTIRFWSLRDGREVSILEVGGHLLGLQYSPYHQALISWTSNQIIVHSTSDWSVIRRDPLSEPKNPLKFRPVATAAHSDLLIRLTGTEYSNVTITRGPITPSNRRPVKVSTYANAKILLLGDTSVGKSGLALVLAGKKFKPTESTHARHVWRMPVREFENRDQSQREVLLWDLAGQPGYRVVHQLHLGLADVALVLFDSRSETAPLAGIGYWARALRNAQTTHGQNAEPIPTFLVAARIDCGVVGVSDERLTAVVEEFGFRALHSTSACEGTGIAELREAVLAAIDWSRIPVVTSSVLFAAVKSFVLDQKAAGSLLSPLSTLHAAFQIMPVIGPAAEAAPQAKIGRNLIDADPDSTDLRGVFEGCVARLESAGLVKQLAFGDLVLLQPELLDVYAGAIVNAARAEPDGLGTILEKAVHEVRFPVPEKNRIADSDQERLLVIATVEELLRHEVVLREETEVGAALVFPSAFRRDLPSAEEPSGERIEFRFDGPVANIYATLVVRLSRTERFTCRGLWQSAARFEADVGGLCTVHLTQADEGKGVLQLAYDDAMAPIVRLQCERFVRAHLDRRATPDTVDRERLYSCPECGSLFSRQQVHAARERGRGSLLCPADETRISLEEPGPGGVDEATRTMNASADAARSAAAATSIVRGKEETGDFDVFLCHNVADKAAVQELGRRLRERGLLPWLDEEQLQPGRPWQRELERRIGDIGAAAVLIGPNGVGPWQSHEVEAFLREFVERRSPVIPVLLPGGVQPDLPVFLRAMTWVDLVAHDALDRLVWGITGQKPWLLS